MLALFKRFSQLVADAFRDDPRFLTSRDKAFKSVVNDTNIFRLELPGRQIGATQKTQPGTADNIFPRFRAASNFFPAIRDLAGGVAAITS